MSLRKVEIIVSSQHSGSEFYKANSYPHRDRDRNNEPDVYRVPVYFLYLKGENEHGFYNRRTNSNRALFRFGKFVSRKGDAEYRAQSSCDRRL